jgi:hypothetical protein
MWQEGGQRAATTPAPTNITAKMAMAAKTQLVLCMLVAFFLLLAMEVAAARKLEETGTGSHLSLPLSVCVSALVNMINALLLCLLQVIPTRARILQWVIQLDHHHSP